METKLDTIQSNNLTAATNATNASEVGVAANMTPATKSTVGKFNSWIVKCVKYIKNKLSIVFRAIISVVTLEFLHNKKIQKIDDKFLSDVDSATYKLINKIDEIISKDDTIKPEKIMRELQLKSSIELLREYEKEPTEADIELIYQAVLTESFFEVYSKYKLNAKTSNNYINNQSVPKIVSEQIKKVIDTTENEKIKQDLKAKLISETEIAKPMSLDHSVIYSYNITTIEQRNDLISHLSSGNVYNIKANEIYGIHSISPDAPIPTSYKVFNFIKHPFTFVRNYLQNKSLNTNAIDNTKR